MKFDSRACNRSLSNLSDLAHQGPNPHSGCGSCLDAVDKKFCEPLQHIDLHKIKQTKVAHILRDQTNCYFAALGAMGFQPDTNAVSRKNIRASRRELDEFGFERIAQIRAPGSFREGASRVARSAAVWF